MTENRMMAPLVALVVMGALAIGFAGAAPVGDTLLVQEDNNTTGDNETIGENDTLGDNVTAEEPDVTFENQTSDGTSLVVNSTTLPDGGFVVVYNATVAAPLGNSSFLESGSQENVDVTLNETLTENQTLVVFAFQDMDGNQEFDLGTDEVYMSNGEPVLDAATVNVSAVGNVTDEMNVTDETNLTDETNVTDETNLTDETNVTDEENLTDETNVTDEINETNETD